MPNAADAIAEVFQTPCEVIDKILLSMFIKVVGLPLMARFIAREDVKGTNHDGIRHGHNSAFLPSLNRQTLIQARHI